MQQEVDKTPTSVLTLSTPSLITFYLNHEHVNNRVELYVDVEYIINII